MDLHSSSLCGSRINCTLLGQVQRLSSAVTYCPGFWSRWWHLSLGATVSKMNVSQKISKHPSGGIASSPDPKGAAVNHGTVKGLGNGGLRLIPGHPRDCTQHYITDKVDF